MQTQSQQDDTDRIIQINNKLRAELLLVIEQMEAQLKRVKQKRKERLDAEYKAMHPESAGQLIEFKKAKAKKTRLREQIRKMWFELENTFNNNELTKMENDLGADKLRLQELYNDTQGSNKVR